MFGEGLQKQFSNTAVSEILIRDRVISVRIMSVVTEVTCKQTTETRVMAFGREGMNFQKEWK